MRALPRGGGAYLGWQRTRAQIERQHAGLHEVGPSAISKDLGQAGRDFVTDVLASISSSSTQLRLRLEGLTRQASTLGARFGG